MATGRVFDGTLYVVNPHVRLDGRECASTATPMRGLLFVKKILLMIFAAVSFVATFAEEITAEQSQIAVSAWMRKYGSISGKTVLRIETIADPQTGAKFHVAVLRGGGFVVTSADDRVLPVMAYSETGTFVNDPENPLLCLLQSDASAAKEALEMNTQPSSASGTKMLLMNASLKSAKVEKTDEQREWDDLLGRTTRQTIPNTRLLASANQMATSSQNAYTETRVKPLLKTVWGQTTHNNQKENSLGGDGLLCFNYYTPEWPIEPTQGTTASGDGVENTNGEDKRYTTHYPCGCVATAGAQIMKRWGKPTRFSFGRMPDDPEKRSSETQRKAIGELTADIGQKCNATYGPNTTMFTSLMVEKLKSSYSYKGAFWQTISGEDLSTFDRQVIPNLIAGCPVSMSIDEKNVNNSGHSVVVDGLQYVNNTRAVHVNCGWNGGQSKNNTWYVPPTFRTAAGTFNRIVGIGINIHPTEKKAIIAGRVSAIVRLNGVLTRLNGGLKGASVVLKKNGSKVNNRSTDAHGQFYFLVDGGTYSLEITNSGYSVTIIENILVTCTDSSVSNYYNDDICLEAATSDRVANVDITPTPMDNGSWYQVVMSCATDGATIHYTTDGSLPTEDSPLYSGEFPLRKTGTITLRAIAFKEGIPPSRETSGELTFRASNQNTQLRLAASITSAAGKIAMNNASATKESGEPVHSVMGKAGGASMWASFTAPEDGDYTFVASGYAEGDEEYSLDTQLAVYTGNSVNALTLVAANDDVNAAEYDLSSKVAFRATKGVSYKIAVDTRNGEKGAINLEWKRGREDVASPEECIIYCSAANGTYSIPIHSTAAWNVCDGSDWISVKKTSGANGDALIFEVPAMTEEGTRNGVLLVCAGEDGPSSTIKIVQEDLIFYDSPIEAQATALAQGKMLFALYGGDWCGWCSVVKRYLKSLGEQFTSRYVLYYCSVDTNFKPIGGYSMPGAGGSPTYAVFDPRTFDYTRGFYEYTARLAYDSGGVAEKVQAVLDAAWSAWQTRNSAPVKVYIAGAEGTMQQSSYAIAATFPDGTVASLTNGVSWSVVSGSAATISEAGVLSPIAGSTGSVVVRGSVMLWGRQYTVTRPVYVFDKSSVVDLMVNGPELIDLYNEAIGRYTVTVTCQDGTKLEVEPEWSVDGAGVDYVQISQGGELSFYSDTYTIYQCATATVTAAYGGFTNTMQTVLYGPGYVTIDKYEVSQNAIWPGCTYTVYPKSVRWWRHGILEEPTSDLSDVAFTWSLSCPGDEYRSGDGNSFTVPSDAFSTNGTCTVYVYSKPDRERYYQQNSNRFNSQFYASRPQMVTMTFDANGGEASFTSSSYVAGKPYGDGFLPKLSRKGYYGSWYTARKGGAQVVYSDNAPMVNTTLYAQWIPRYYYLAFDANGGEGEMDAQYLYYDTPATIRERSFKKDGCSFMGWALSPDGPVAYQDKQEILNLRDSYDVITLYAVWRDLGIMSSIVGLTVRGPELIDLYDKPGGRYAATVTCQDGTTVEVEPVWSVNGEHVRYAQMSQGGELSFYYDTYTVYQCETVTVTAVYGGFTATKKTVLYGPGYVESIEYTVPQNAVWPGCTFSVTPQAVRWWRHGGLEEPTSDLSDVAFTWSLNCPGDKFRSGDGTSFTVPLDAFSTNGNCSVLIYFRPDRERYYSEYGEYFYVRFYASRPQMVTVTFDANGGEASFTSLNCVAGKPYGSGFLPTLTRKGYYGDWYTAREGGTEVTCSDNVPAVNTTLYAQWIPRYYYLAFDANGGEGEMDAQYLYYDTPATIRARTFNKDGYSFMGWALSPEGPVVYHDGEEVLNLRDSYDRITLYAVWRQNDIPQPGPVVATCTVTFDANDGSTDESIREMKKNSKLGTLPKATRKGYTFSGWYTKKSGGTKIKASTKVTKDVTYYAQWNANKYTIKFNANGGTGSMRTMSATYGKNVTLAANAFKRTNWTFLGWATKKSATEAECANKAKVKNLTVTDGKTVTLYAVWKHNTYTVKFNANGGTGTTVKQTVNCGSKTALSKNTYAREGFLFAGWATKKDGKVVYKNKAKVKDLAKKGKSVTLYAVWKPEKWAVGTFTGGGEIGGKAANVTLTVASDGKISGKFVRTKNKKSYSFKADNFQGFEDGALRATTSMKYGKKTCSLEIAVAQDSDTGKSMAAIGVTYSGNPYGSAALDK